MKAVDVVIMAAGKGTRMHSSMPKVLQHLGDKALVQHVIDTAKALQARTTVVITGHGAELVEAALAAYEAIKAKLPAGVTVSDEQIVALVSRTLSSVNTIELVAAIQADLVALVKKGRGPVKHAAVDVA